MKTSIAPVAITLVYLVSFVTADHQMMNDMNATDVNVTKHGKGNPSLFVPVGVISNIVDAKNNTILVTDSNIVISLNDRVQLAHIIKDILPKISETGPASTLSIEDLVDLLTRISATPGFLPKAADIVSAAKSGNTDALAGHVVGLLRAAGPAVDPAAPTATTPLLARIVPQAPPMSPPVALAAAATTST